jgi:hypothetical protein
VRFNNTNFEERFRQRFKSVALYQRQHFYALRQHLKTVAYSKKQKNKKKPELDATMGWRVLPLDATLWVARPSYGRYIGDGASPSHQKVVYFRIFFKS